MSAGEKLAYTLGALLVCAFLIAQGAHRLIEHEAAQDHALAPPETEVYRGADGTGVLITSWGDDWICVRWRTGAVGCFAEPGVSSIDAPMPLQCFDGMCRKVGDTEPSKRAILPPPIRP